MEHLSQFRCSFYNNYSPLYKTERQYCLTYKSTSFMMMLLTTTVIIINSAFDLFVSYVCVCLCKLHKFQFSVTNMTKFSFGIQNCIWVRVGYTVYMLMMLQFWCNDNNIKWNNRELEGQTISVTYNHYYNYWSASRFCISIAINGPCLFTC